MSKIKSTMIFLAGIVACSVAAEESMVKGINWRYSVTDGTACIEGFANMPAASGQSVEDCNRKMITEKICKKTLSIPGKIGKHVVTAIGEDAITITEGPASIKVPDSVTSIGKFAFGGNPNLESVSLPSKLTSIPVALFHTCKNLKSVKIPASVKSIGIEAFAECKGLKAITIPEGVKSIDRLAFRDCFNLASVSISASVTNVGAAAFIRCSNLAKIKVAKGSRAYCNRAEKGVAGALFSKDGTKLVAWPAGSPIAAVTIPAGVTSIDSWAFAECTKITSISIPASVTNIGDCAFINCPKLSVIYAEAGDLDRLKSVIAEHNPKTGEQVVGRRYREGDSRDQMDKIRIEEKSTAKKK